MSVAQRPRPPKISFISGIRGCGRYKNNIRLLSYLRSMMLQKYDYIALNGRPTEITVLPDILECGSIFCEHCTPLQNNRELIAQNQIEIN